MQQGMPARRGDLRHRYRSEGSRHQIVLLRAQQQGAIRIGDREHLDPCFPRRHQRQISDESHGVSRSGERHGVQVSRCIRARQVEDHQGPLPLSGHVHMWQGPPVGHHIRTLPPHCQGHGLIWRPDGDPPHHRGILGHGDIHRGESTMYAPSEKLRGRLRRGVDLRRGQHPRCLVLEHHGDRGTLRQDVAWLRVVGRLGPVTPYHA